jgi:hypothetical protein
MESRDIFRGVFSAGVGSLGLILMGTLPGRTREFVVLGVRVIPPETSLVGIAQPISLAAEIGVLQGT